MIRQTETTSIVWWLVLPLGFFIFTTCMQLFLPDSVAQGLLTEGGPIELLQALIVFLAFLVAAWTLPLAIKSGNRLIKIWIILAAIGTFYITGEELSWGQHFFLWSTPESWMAINDHHETNLHNTTSWLDQKPRTLLEIGMLVGGLLLPLYRARRSDARVERFAFILPPDFLWLTAACLWLSKLFKDLDGIVHVATLIRTSETNEVYIYYFMLIYLLALRLRLQRWPRS